MYQEKEFLEEKFQRRNLSGILTLDNILEEQVSLQDAIEGFKESTKPNILRKKPEKKTLNNAIIFFFT